MATATGHSSLEAVSPIPMPHAVRIRGDVRRRLESHELPRPSREGGRTLAGGKIENDMASRGIPGPRVEDDVRIERAFARRVSVDDLRARFDPVEIRRRDRAEVTRSARVFRAFFGDLEIPAPSHDNSSFCDLPLVIDPTSDCTPAHNRGISAAPRVRSDRREGAADAFATEEWRPTGSAATRS